MQAPGAVVGPSVRTEAARGSPRLRARPRSGALALAPRARRLAPEASPFGFCGLKTSQRHPKARGTCFEPHALTSREVLQFRLDNKAANPATRSCQYFLSVCSLRSNKKSNNMSEELQGNTNATSLLNSVSLAGRSCNTHIIAAVADSHTSETAQPHRNRQCRLPRPRRIPFPVPVTTRVQNCNYILQNRTQRPNLISKLLLSHLSLNPPSSVFHSDNIPTPPQGQGQPRGRLLLVVPVLAE